MAVVLSFIYMKILESQPARYDRGIGILSFGSARKALSKLVDENVRPGYTVLDIGCGTGSAAILAAEKGARVVGIDVSSDMLAVAREKIVTAGLSEAIELINVGISRMDELPESRFDLIMSTLVFSELSADEQDYTLRQARGLLKPGAVLALIDEVPPRRYLLRVLYRAIRFPLLLLTFLLTQTTTTAVSGLSERVALAGFSVESETRTGMDSVLYLRARVGGIS